MPTPLSLARVDLRPSLMADFWAGLPNKVDAECLAKDLGNAGSMGRISVTALYRRKFAVSHADNHLFHLAIVRCF